MWVTVFMKCESFFGPGWRICYTIRDENIIIMLGGGDKSTQSSDIAKAKQLLDDWMIENVPKDKNF